MSYKNFFFIN